MTPERAETIALQALGWLAADQDLCDTFLGATGASPDDLRQRAAESAFLASVLGFLTMNDDWIIGFCDNVGLGYDQPLRALHALPGQEQVDWT
jgi:hypothetical protein